MNRDGKYYIYRQKEYAMLVYYRGFQTQYVRHELMLMGLYLRDVGHFSNKVIETQITAFCKRYMEQFNPRRDYEMIQDVMRKVASKKNRLIQIDEIVVYQDEIDCIRATGASEDIQRLMFTILVQKKIDKINYETRHPYKQYNPTFLSSDERRNKKLAIKAGFDAKKDISGGLLHEMKERGWISVLPNGVLRLHFLPDLNRKGGEAIIRVKDYRAIGMYWDHYLGKKTVGLCGRCGSPFRRTVHNRKTCNECLARKWYVGYLTRTRKCEICGQLFLTDARIGMKPRCDTCQKKHRNDVRRERRRLAAERLEKERSVSERPPVGQV